MYIVDSAEPQSQTMPKSLTTISVFLAALMVLGWNAGSSGIATGYVDPVARIQAQDEAVYGSTSITMATEGTGLLLASSGRYSASSRIRFLYQP
jgi:hypothetical protein